MNAKNVLLTHFSARYPKMPPTSSLKEGAGPTVALALDQARIRIGDMGKLSKYLPAIEQSFGDIQGEELDDEDMIA